MSGNRTAQVANDATDEIGGAAAREKPAPRTPTPKEPMPHQEIGQSVVW
jgi:hypothetical protein